MSAPFAPGEVIREGRVGRAVFQSGEWRRAAQGKKMTPRSVFFDTKNPVKISIQIFGVEPDQKLAKICDGIARQRGENRKFYGWAELSAEKAGEDGRMVQASPQPENPSHADIVLPCEKEDKKQRRWHAERLAANAAPRSRP